MLISRITEGETRHFKTNRKQTPITIMVINLCFWGCCKF